MSEYSSVTSHGIWRRVFRDAVTFQPDWLAEDDVAYEWDYAVFKWPFVPGFHVVHMYYGVCDEDAEDVMSSHKTLAEAMGVLRVLLANGGVRHV